MLPPTIGKIWDDEMAALAQAAEVSSAAERLLA
jgi:hypothetical protein